MEGLSQPGCDKCDEYRCYDSTGIRLQVNRETGEAMAYDGGVRDCEVLQDWITEEIQDIIDSP